MRITAVSEEGGRALNGFSARHWHGRVAGSTISCRRVSAPTNMAEGGRRHVGVRNGKVPFRSSVRNFLLANIGSLYLSLKLKF